MAENLKIATIHVSTIDSDGNKMIEKIDHPVNKGWLRDNRVMARVATQLAGGPITDFTVRDIRTSAQQLRREQRANKEPYPILEWVTGSRTVEHLRGTVNRMGAWVTDRLNINTNEPSSVVRAPL